LNKSKRELTQDEIAVRRNADEILTPVDRFLDVSEANLNFEQSLTSLMPTTGPKRNAALKIGGLFVRGNITYNGRETQNLIHIARDEVTPDDRFRAGK
jgi:hypothetical protein